MNVFKRYQTLCFQVVAFGLFIAFQAVSAFAAPITFNTALPVSEEEVILREQLIYTDLSSPNVDVNSLTAVLAVMALHRNGQFLAFCLLPILMWR